LLENWKLWNLFGRWCNAHTELAVKLWNRQRRSCPHAKHARV